MHGSCHSSVHGHHHHHSRHHNQGCATPQQPVPADHHTPQPAANTVYYWPVPVCPACRYPVDNCICHHEYEHHHTDYVQHVQELLATATSGTVETIIGGEEPAAITVELLADSAATAPSVTLVFDDGSGVTTVVEDGFGSGYQTKNDYALLPPGTRLSLTAQESIARVRWIENII